MKGRGIVSVALSVVLAVGLCPSVGWSQESIGTDSATTDVSPENAAVHSDGADGLQIDAQDSTHAAISADSQTDGSEVTAPEYAGGLGEFEWADDFQHASGTGASGAQETPADSKKSNKANPEEEESDVPEDALEEGAYFVRSAADASFVLDVDGSSVFNGANVALWKANGTNAQRFWISCDGEGCSLRAMCSGKALDVADDGQEEGANVQQMLYDESDFGQKWRLVENEDGTCSFISCVNGMALDVAGGVAAEGANVQTQERDDSLTQRFVLERTGAFQEGVYTLLSSIDADKAVDIVNCLSDAGVPTQLVSRNDSPAQKYRIELSGDGSYLIKPLCSGLSLANADGRVVQSEDAGVFAEWTIVPSEYGVSFVNNGTGLLLDVTGGMTANETPVGTYEENGTRAQGFLGVPVDVLSAGTYRISCAVDGRAIDLAGGAFGNGANVQTWDDNGSGAQRWEVKPVGDGLVCLVNAKTGMAMDVTNTATAPGTNVQVWDYSASNVAQQFLPIPTDDGYYYLMSVCSGLYLDVASGGGWNGANVQIWTPNETAAQKFRFVPMGYSRSAADVRDGIDTASGSWGISGFGGYAPSEGVVAQLQSGIDRVRSRGNDVGFVMIDLQSGKGVSCNADGSFYAASTVKGPYVAAVCSMNPWAIGGWAGTMEPTIRWSSNEGYMSLRNAFGPGPMWEWCSRSGVRADISNLNYPHYSPRELAKLWTSNYEYFTSDPNGGWVGSWYTSSTNSQLFYQLGGMYTIQSKPGWYPEYGYYAAANDAGIVWANNGAYLVAILTNVPGDTSRISDLVWAIEAAHNEMAAS